jgi:hypothetical protein
LQELSPRAITRSELGCDEPAALKAEIVSLLRRLGRTGSPLERFTVLHDAGATDGSLPLRVQWAVQDAEAAAALRSELSSEKSLLHFEQPPPETSDRHLVWGYLSLTKVLAKHPVIAALRGSPKATALAVGLLAPSLGSGRSLADLAGLLSALVIDDPAGLIDELGRVSSREQFDRPRTPAEAERRDGRISLGPIVRSTGCT